jgi:hypothetical protein
MRFVFGTDLRREAVTEESIPPDRATAILLEVLMSQNVWVSSYEK